jgi:hypothetical protein
VVQIEFAAHSPPLLPQEAEHAPKGEFIPEPRSVGAIVLVSAGSVPANVRRRRMRERSGAMAAGHGD